MKRRNFLKGTGAAVALLAAGIKPSDADVPGPIKLPEKPTEPPCGNWHTQAPEKFEMWKMGNKFIEIDKTHEIVEYIYPDNILVRTELLNGRVDFNVYPDWRKS